MYVPRTVDFEECWLVLLLVVGYLLYSVCECFGFVPFIGDGMRLACLRGVIASSDLGHFSCAWHIRLCTSLSPAAKYV